ncbi:MAG: heat-inducible transcriptional repressor HrcA [Actinomycetota bacterium]
MPETLVERQAEILRAVVREYIRTGEPIGSKHLVDRSHLQVSAATVRNEMAHLEEMGYLVQPHTSAGRVPTDAGYRFLVDEIKTPPRLAEGRRHALESEITGEAGGTDELARRAGDVLSRFTHHAAAVLSRRARPSRLRRVEIFSTASRLAMVVLIAENGRVEQRVIPIEAPLRDTDIERMADPLCADLRGVTLDDAIADVATRARTGPQSERAFMESLCAALRALQESDEHVVVGGVANLASEQDFERETLHRLYEAIERQTALLELLASSLESAPVTVRIGSEVPSEDFRSCSIVVAEFGLPGADRGSVGVIGPTRMEYGRVIATANAVARALEGALGTHEPRT